MIGTMSDEQLLTAIGIQIDAAMTDGSDHGSVRAIADLLGQRSRAEKTAAAAVKAVKDLIARKQAIDERAATVQQGAAVRGSNKAIGEADYIPGVKNRHGPDEVICEGHAVCDGHGATGIPSAKYEHTVNAALGMVGEKRGDKQTTAAPDPREAMVNHLARALCRETGDPDWQVLYGEPSCGYSPWGKYTYVPSPEESGAPQPLWHQYRNAARIALRVMAEEFPPCTTVQRLLRAWKALENIQSECTSGRQLIEAGVEKIHRFCKEGLKG